MKQWLVIYTSMKRVFVSTSYSKLYASGLLVSDLGLNECFNIFNPNKGAYSEVCYWDSSVGKFKPWIDNAPVDDADLFFIDCKLDQLPDSLNVNGDSDYLLAHEGTPETSEAIRSLFMDEHILKGHHGKLNHSEEAYKYHAYVMQILQDGQVAASEKTEAIIKKNWPLLEQLKKERLDYLTEYMNEKPAQEKCPSVFGSSKEVLKAFEDLKKYEPGQKMYTAALRLLRDLSYEKLYNQNQ